MASNPELSLTVDFFKDLVPMFSNQIPSIKDLKNQLILETTAQMPSQLGRCYVFGYSNPKGYEKGDEIFVITYILTKGGEYKKNIDGFKPIGQTVPQYTPQQMTEAQPSAPENAQPITMEDHKALSELDDEIPF